MPVFAFIRRAIGFYVQQADAAAPEGRGRSTVSGPSSKAMSGIRSWGPI